MSITVTTVSGVQYSGTWNLTSQGKAKSAGTWPVETYPLFSWGGNSQGELGLNLAPVVDSYRSSPTQIGSLTTWRTVKGGFQHNLSLKTDGTLWSWGRNMYGQLGDSSVANKSSPVQVGALTTWSKVSPGYYFSTAIKTDGTLWVWGQNNQGQLGQSNTTYCSSPVQVGSEATWTEVSTGIYHVLAVKTDGTLWSWGGNTKGQLGLNTAVQYYSSPKQVGNLTTWSKVECGGYTSFAIKTDGTIWSWGWNQNGELGQNIPYTTYRSSPVQIGSLTTWSSVSATTWNTFATKTDGTLWGWGRNVEGQIGDQTTIARSSPVQVGALTNWSIVSSTQRTTAAIKTDGSLWTWGGNNQGQLGQNTDYSINISSPVQVGTKTWVAVSKTFYLWMVGVQKTF